MVQEQTILRKTRDGKPYKLNKMTIKEIEVTFNT